MKNEFRTARRASGMTLSQIADACGIAKVTYTSIREPDPGSFKLKELRGLYDSMDDTSRTILVDAVRDFICT